ncbi:MobV family relaxase [Nonlabens sp. YIK11]|uniref:MobV family relaxase n=1 Tax=Nonlabens sp. YIK11 TaxID=1453349 RepID=UPI0006DC2C69|nr:MobV family relaxase [Nonlabens sp. YIK11]
MGNFAVMVVSKGKGSGAGVGGHIDREEKWKHTYKHADPTKTHLNRSYPVPNKFHDVPVPIAINRVIQKGYKKTRKNSNELAPIRKDAVRLIKHIFTGSHEEMMKLAADEDKFFEWQKACSNFLQREYGKDNIVRFVLHMDEKTPHIHAITVPLTEDGRLSAKEIIGNKEVLRERLDRYAEIVKPFGLERGLRYSGTTHETQQAYNARLERANEMAMKKEVPDPSKMDMRLKPEKVKEDFQKIIRDQQMLINMAQRSEEERKKSKERMDQHLDQARKLMFSAQKEAKDYKQLQIAMRNPKFLETQLNAVLEQRNQRNQGRNKGKNL